MRDKIKAEVEQASKRCRTRVLSELEKTCVTDRSFEAARKSVHDAFDDLNEELQVLFDPMVPFSHRTDYVKEGQRYG